MAKKTRDELVAYAIKRAKEHHKYRNSGKKSWKTFVNCTWFVGLCFRDCGYTDIAKRILSHGYWKTPYGKKFLGKWLVKYRKQGLREKDLKPGDIVVKKTRKPGVHHSGIYVGDGRVAEAVGSGTRIGPLKGRKYIYAFRCTPEPKKKKKKKVVEHKAKYKLMEYRNCRKSYTSKSALVKKLKKNTEVETTKKCGNWVYLPKYKGWICMKNNAKKICLKKI